MGYTHYFTQKETPSQEQWSKIETGFKKVLGLPECPHVWGDYEEKDSSPFVDSEHVLFNGGHETMYIQRVAKSNDDFNFCKTAGGEYDSVVVALLVLMNSYAPNAWVINSDGEPHEWEDGLNLAKQATGDNSL